METGAHHIAIDVLKSMEQHDRDMLLSATPTEQLGLIIMLNQEPRYHNSLDAIALMSNLRDAAMLAGSGVNKA